MKKKKLKIESLIVESFITDVREGMKTVKGGQTYDCPPPTHTCQTIVTFNCCGGGTGGGGGTHTLQQITICDITACNA